MALELAGWTENSTYIQYAASKSDMFFSFRSTNFLNAERLTRKRLWASWKWFRSLSTQDDQHRQEVPGEAKGDQFSLELKLASRWLHSSSLTLRKRSLYSLPVLRGQARCIHSGLFDCECVCLLLPNLPWLLPLHHERQGLLQYSSFLPHISPHHLRDMAVQVWLCVNRFFYHYYFLEGAFDNRIIEVTYTDARKFPDAPNRPHHETGPAWCIKRTWRRACS